MKGTAQGSAQEKEYFHYEYYLIMIIYKILIDKVLFNFYFAISEEVVMKLDRKEERKAGRKRKIMFIMNINKL